MKKRSPIAVFLLSLITFGIYDIYWLVVTKKELNAKTKIHTPTIWLLFAPFILIFAVALVLGIVAGSSGKGSDSSSVLTIITLVIYGLSFLVILPIQFYWFFNFSKAVHEYTSGKMNTGVSFLLLWLLHLLGVAIIQDTFNDMIDAGGVPGQPVPAAEAASPMMTPQAPAPQAFASPEPTAPASPETPDQQPPAGPVAG